MQAGLSPARPARACHRHELTTLIRVTLDQANGGIIRNLSHEGIAVQAVAAVRPGQKLHVRFELPPRLRVEAWSEVVWADSGNQCGIRFLDLAPQTARRVDEWIFGDLLESVPPHSHRGESITSGLFASRLAPTPPVEDAAEDDGLIVSPSPVKVIELPVRPDPVAPVGVGHDATSSPGASADLDWLSQPLSRHGVEWLINGLALVAALLLFALVFLFVTREIPKWPAAMAGGAAIVVSILYWGFFRVFGGDTPGARLARLLGYDPRDAEEPQSARFR